MAGFINIPWAGLATGVAVIAILWLSLYLPIIIMHGISKRTGHGWWWTAWLFFVYPIFFPVTAFHYEKWDEIKPRPFTGIKKFFLILAATIWPIILIIGILAAALFPSLTTYLSRGRDTARMSGIKEISTGLMAYQIDNGKYPTTPTGWCIPIKDLNTVLYSKSTIIDPIKKLTPGCDGSDGQTYAYRTWTASNWKTYIVLGAKMESSRSWNSNESIDAITPDTVLVRWKGNMYYVVDSSF